VTRLIDDLAMGELTSAIQHKPDDHRHGPSTVKLLSGVWFGHQLLDRLVWRKSYRAPSGVPQIEFSPASAL